MIFGRGAPADLGESIYVVLFRGYKQACTAADLMLMGLGNLEVIEQRC
jgi:hypothetical protein